MNSFGYCFGSVSCGWETKIDCVKTMRDFAEGANRCLIVFASLKQVYIHWLWFEHTNCITQTTTAPVTNNREVSLCAHEPRRLL